MKKIFTVVAAAVLCAACSSNKSNVKTAQASNVSAKDAKYQIIDQEFDNLLAPETDYDTLPAYELQACGDSYLPPAEVKLKGTEKPAKKAAKKQKTEQNPAMRGCQKSCPYICLLNMTPQEIHRMTFQAASVPHVDNIYKNRAGQHPL